MDSLRPKFNSMDGCSNLFAAMFANPYSVAELPFGEVAPDPLQLEVVQTDGAYSFVDRISYICAWEALIRSFTDSSFWTTTRRDTSAPTASRW